MRSPTGATRGLNLLLVYDCIYPESLGGVEHRNHELAKALGARGHRVTLAGFTAEPRRIGPTAEILSIGEPGRLYTESGRRSVREALRLARALSVLDLRDFDVVETANIPYVHIFPLALRCRRLGKPLLVTWYEYWGVYWRSYLGPARWLLFAAVEWLAAQLGTATLAVSRITADRLNHHRRAEAAETIPLGLAIDRVRSSADGAPSGPPLVYAGRLQKEKRLDLLLTALQRLAPHREKPLLTIIGDGPERARLENLARQLGLTDRVVFAGHLPENRDVWRLMSGARVAVQPSSREGFGLFPLEAMALGLPVIYCESSESAVSELVLDGEQGLCARAEPGDLARTIERLLSDPEECKRLGASAALRAEEYDWSRIAGRLEKMLSHLALGARPPSTAGG